MYYSFKIMFEIIEKALTIMLLATAVKFGKMVKKPWLKNYLSTNTYQNIFQELRLIAKEEF